MSSNKADVAKDLTAGTVAGVAQLLVGHPFDTIKVKLQAQPKPAPGQPPMYAGAMDAVRKTIAAEGAKGLYAGIGPPLATVAVFNAVLFTARGQMEAILKSTPDEQLSVGKQMIAGAGAGLAVSFVACPTELVKCRLQAQSALAAAPVRIKTKFTIVEGTSTLGMTVLLKAEGSSVNLTHVQVGRIAGTQRIGTRTGENCAEIHCVLWYKEPRHSGKTFALKRSRNSEVIRHI